MSLRISKAELNSLLHVVPVEDADDPALDVYLDEQANLDFLDVEAQEKYDWYDQEQQERNDDGCIDYLYYDPYEYDWYDLDPLDDFVSPPLIPAREKTSEVQLPPRLLTIGEIIAKNKAELFHEH